MKTRVLIADAQLSFRRRLREMLERKQEIDVVGETSDTAGTYRAIEQLRPDILLIDLALCKQPATLPFGVGSPSWQRTVVMLPAIDNGSVVEAFRCGAQGILLKSAAPLLWRKAIRRVMDGQYCFENGSVAVLLEAFRTSIAMQAPIRRSDYGLSSRELEIVAKIVAGHSNREVGQHFSICERTVKHHLTNIFAKLGVSSRLELALFAVNNRLVVETSIVKRPLKEEKELVGGHAPAVAVAGIS
jgi:DNA-binding NarL/FixJ family response regulator